MTSRERVKKKLEFKIPDFKIFNLDDPDLEKKIAADETTDKFLTLSFSGPFEILSRKKGRLNLLREIASTAPGYGAIWRIKIIFFSQRHFTKNTFFQSIKG